MSLVGWESYRDTIRVADAAAARKHSFEVRGLLTDAAAQLVDAETGQRGFLLTGDETYLEPYRKATKNVYRIIGELKNGTADNPNQQKRIQALEVLSDEKLTELQKTIDLRKTKGLAAANLVVRSGEGKQWMDQIREILAEMEEEEDHIRTVRSREMTDALRRTSRIVVAGSLLSGLLLLGVFVLLSSALTERQRAQEAAEKSEKWLATTLSSIGDAVIVTDMNGAISFMNPVAESLTGWSLADARGKSMDLVFDILNKETRRPVENPVKKVFREGKVVGLADHTILLSKGGKEFDIEDSAAPIVTDVGEEFGVVLVFRDITEQKRAEDERRRTQIFLDSLIENLPSMIFVKDAKDLKFVRVNRACEDLLSHSREDLIGRNDYDLFPKGQADFFNAKDREVLESGKLLDITEEPIRTKHRATRLLHTKKIPLLDASGRPQYLLGISEDITERKQAEEALKASEQRLNLALDAAQLGIWELDLVNDKAYRTLRHDQIFGYQSLRPDWGYEIFITHVVPEDREAVKKSFEKAFATGDFSMECRIVWPDKSIHWISAHGRVFRNDKGDPIRMMGTVADVTGRKQAEEAIVRAKEEAERTSKFKDQFLSTMSHELRTPLNAVLGFSDLLNEERYGPLNERQRRYVNHIHTGGTHLLRLINDILDLSKIEAGRLQLAIESVRVNSSFIEAVDTLRPLADKKSQTLVQRPSPELSVRADATRFKQILMNLLGNAIKFTPEGGKIELGVQENGDVARVEVRDSGPGIPLEEQQRIFEAFHRLQQSDKTLESTGLGLAITRRLVELHGGHLGVESQPGAGSCFYFTLPISPTIRTEESRKSVPSFQAGESPTVLVVEDDTTAAHLIQSHLVSAGYDVVLCDQPSAAVESAAERQPAAITLDIIMKPLNGWELLANLKSDPRTARIPVVVVTIVDQPGTGALLGADEYIVKPVEKATLLAAVERCLNRHARAGQARPILVVEDDTPTREFIAELLCKHGYVVGTAADGPEARAKVADSLPELVILDLILPGMSGFQLLTEWRMDSRTADLPVFVLTSKDLTTAEKDYIHTNTRALFHKQERWQESLIQQLQRVVPPMFTERS